VWREPPGGVNVPARRSKIAPEFAMPPGSLINRNAQLSG